jgi:tRNA wybutosine-synthesizing protein 3
MAPSPPSLPQAFISRKALILSALSLPAEEYDDLSPKGSIDEGIRGLIEGINARDGWVTTSSCAGRCVVFAEGLRQKAVMDENDSRVEQEEDRVTGEGGDGAAGGEEGEEGEEEEQDEVEEDKEQEKNEAGVGDDHVDGDEERGDAGKGSKMKLAGAGGKGGGGRWLFVSHEPVDMGEVKGKDFSSFLGMKRMGGVAESGRPFTDERLIHFKFEPMVRGILSFLYLFFCSLEASMLGCIMLLAMFIIPVFTMTSPTCLANIFQILHVLTASFSHAQTILKAALQAGFRESGALNLTSATSEAPTPIVAVRSTGLGLDSIIGRLDDDGEGICVVSDTYLEGVLAVANERFEENSKRITRFCELLLGIAETPSDTEARKPKGEDWEDASVRRERKRAEGLKRSRELRNR